MRLANCLSRRGRRRASTFGTTRFRVGQMGSMPGSNSDSERGEVGKFLFVMSGDSFHILTTAWHSEMRHGE